MCNDAMTGLRKDLYATFARTIIQVEVQKLVGGIIKLLRKFNWTEVAILYENRTNYIRMKDAVVEEFHKNGITVLLQKELLDEKCYIRVLYNERYNITCEHSRVKNVTSYMQGMFAELREKARSKLDLVFVMYKLMF